VAITAIYRKELASSIGAVKIIDSIQRYTDAAEITGI